MALRQIPPDEIIVGDRHRKDMGDIDALAASIQSLNCLLHPIVVDKDLRLIAGERRLEAVKKLGWPKVPANVVTSLTEATKLIEAERDENTCRKDFTPSEAVALGKRLEDLLRPAAEQSKQEGRSKGGKTAGKGRPKANSLQEKNLEAKPDPQVRDKVGASVGMSGRTYEKAKAVVESGDNELIERMDKTGKVEPAFKEMKRKEANEKARAASQRAQKKIKRGDESGVFHGDSFELSRSIPDESCALIFTDPPYDRKSLQLFFHLGYMASRILIDGGSLVTYCGQYLVDDVISLVTGSLDVEDGNPGDEWGELYENGNPVLNDMRFFWVLCCRHTGNTAQMREYGIKVKWKPMLWFVKGEFRRNRTDWVDDLIESRQEKESHEWQQSVIEASYYIDRLTKRGELVVDPFCGGGTTAVAAKSLSRLWWTADIEATHVDTARRRIIDTNV